MNRVTEKDNCHVRKPKIMLFITCIALFLPEFLRSFFSGPLVNLEEESISFLFSRKYEHYYFIIATIGYINAHYLYKKEKYHLDTDPCSWPWYPHQTGSHKTVSMEDEPRAGALGTKYAAGGIQNFITSVWACDDKACVLMANLYWKVSTSFFGRQEYTIIGSFDRDIGFAFPHAW